MGNVNIPITAIVKKGKAKLFPQGDCPSCAPKVSPAGWPMKASPIKDIDNFRDDRRDYEKSKYKKGSSPVKQMSKVLKAPCPTCGKMMGKCKNCGN